jgi:hypothetical protein
MQVTEFQSKYDLFIEISVIEVPAANKSMQKLGGWKRNRL